jgi:recombination protein RecA
MGNERRRGRTQRLDMAVAAIQRRYGPWTLAKGGAPGTGPAAVAHISTGFRDLDLALGTGGLPKGCICELVGPATSGKTTVALKFLAQAQSGGKQVGYVDQALYFDPDYAYRCGVDLSRLLVGTPTGLQETLAMVEALVRGGDLSALAVDLLDFLWEDAGAAALLAAALNRLRPSLARSGTVLLVLHDSPAGSAPTLSSVAHAATVRLQVVRERWLKRHDDVRGYEARVEVLKNRLGPAGRSVTLAIEFNGTVRGNGL